MRQRRPGLPSLIVALLLAGCASAQAFDGRRWHRVVNGSDGVEMRDADGAPVDHPCSRTRMATVISTSSCRREPTA